jgi:hypothetical protein
MPWRDSKTVKLTRIDVVSQIPSDSGVYAILEADVCLLVGEAWNLKARLLEMMNVLQDVGEFQVVYELCPEAERVARKNQLGAMLIRSTRAEEVRSHELPGITFWNSTSTGGR